MANLMSLAGCLPPLMSDMYPANACHEDIHLCSAFVARDPLSQDTLTDASGESIGMLSYTAHTASTRCIPWGTYLQCTAKRRVDTSA